MKSALIIDGHNLLFKSFAVPYKFSSQSGTPLHVITTFLSLIRKAYIMAGQPCFVQIVFDSENLKQRNKEYPEYKHNRRYHYDNGDSPFVHLPNIKIVLDKMKVNWIENTEYEADDIIASLTTSLCKNKYRSIYICSTDKDFYQLLNKKIKIMKLTNRRNQTIYTQKSFKKDFIFDPCKYVEYKAYVGDRSDNIPGIKGIGHKTAIKIINENFAIKLSKPELIDYQKYIRLILLNKNIKINIEKDNFDQKNLFRSNKEIFYECNF